MTNKQLDLFCKKPIIKDKELICRTVLNMSKCPVNKMYNQSLTVTINGEKKSWADERVKQLSEYLLDSAKLERRFGYDALQNYSVHQLFSRISHVKLTYKDEGWVMYLLSLISLGFAIDMENTGKILGLNKK